MHSISTAEIDSIKVFFIIGRPRSGTTMLRTLFDALPEVSIPLESKVMILLYLKYGKIQKWNRDLISKFHAEAMAETKLQAWQINKENTLNDMLQLDSSATFSRLIKILYLNYLSFYDKETILYIGDKNPEYSYVLYYLKILLSVFPEAKVIHLTRDYRDHYLSMSRVDFEGNHLSLVSYRWKYSFLGIKKIMKSRPDNYYFIRYEDLVQEPGLYLKKMCDFLGIRYHESALRFYEKKDEVLKVYSYEDVMRYHSNLFSPISADFIDKWKTRMSDVDIARADFITGKAGIEAGYIRGEQSTRFFNNYFWLLKQWLYVLPDRVYSRCWLVYKRLFDRMNPGGSRRTPFMSKIYFKIFRRHKKKSPSA
jgi:hypothetical protein